MPVVDITLLNRFSVSVAGVPVPDHAWHRRSASGVVKLLALSEGRALHREQVTDLLWPDLPPTSAMPRLHQAAQNARSALGLRDGVVLHHDRVLLLPHADVRVDVVDLRRRADRALRAGTSADAESVLAEYAGELLPEDLYAEWAAVHRETLAALRGRLADLVRRDVPAGPRGSARGLLVIVDDLAGADAASLRLLHRVAASITARGIGRVLEIG